MADKYFVMSFDDNTTQDKKLLETLRSNGLVATFNINTGLCGANWEWVADMVHTPGLTHIRFSEEELSSDLYDGMDIAAHSLTHPSLAALDEAGVIREMKTDCDNIKRIFGVNVTGMAYPGGSPDTWNDNVIRTILANTPIRYSRTGASTNSFDLPEYFMEWNGTCSISSPDLLPLADKFIALEPTSDALFYVWGHSFELDINRTISENFEKLCRKMSCLEGVKNISCSDFYSLYKGKIPSWK